MLALEQAIQIIEAQETWDVHDDRCDCIYQRMGYWNNPYVGETYEVRLCCLFAEFEKQYPHLFKRTQIEPAEWNGEADMPQSLYHRQLSKLHGISVSEARAIAGDAPKGTPRAQKPQLYLPWSGEFILAELG